MASIIFNLLIRGAILGLDAVGSPPEIDLVGDDGNGTGKPGICIVHFDCKGSDGKTSSCEAIVNCNGASQTYQASTIDVGGSWSFSDDRVGHITVNWSGSTFDEYPFPSAFGLVQDVYKQHPSAEGGGCGIQSLAPSTGPKTLEIKDCNNKARDVRVGTLTGEGDNQGYAIAFPWIGNAKACNLASS